jgi:hypothetical protein
MKDYVLLKDTWTMRTKIVWAELHAPLFLNGSNLGQKLDHTTKGGVSMEYDEKQRHLHVNYKGAVARIPETSVLSMVEADATPRAAVAAAVKEVGKPITAQASSPTDHVFAGAGGGQTGQEKSAMQEAFEKAGGK